MEQAKLVIHNIGKELANASDRVEALRQDYDHFMILRDILKSLTGITLVDSPKNMSLMAARLAKPMHRLTIANYAEYISRIRSGDKVAEKEFVCALTTNTTEFFRESRHFELLTKILPEYVQKQRQKYCHELRVWCAASSTGQEPYTIAMSILEAVPQLAEGGLKILATDIDTEVLERAAQGLYTSNEAASIPPIFRQKYFVRIGTKQSERFRVSDKVSRMITFAKFNLMQPQYPFQHGFDIVFCRNVLIYFERHEATEVTTRLLGSMNPGGYLFVGHSEVGIVKPELVHAEASAVYCKVTK